MTLTHDHLRPRQTRSAFTLIELLVVVIIIAILVALLIPAVAAAIRTTRAAAVQAEISQMAQALADFKNKMGDYPPSRVLLYENGAMPTAATTIVPSGGLTNPNDITEGTLAVRTLTAFRKFWPRVQFNTSGGAYWTSSGFGGSTTWYDFNGDASNAGIHPYILQGNECLTFFLGGIPLATPSDPNDPNSPPIYTMTGFATDPVNPFKHSHAPIPGQAPSPMYSANRTPPFFEFSSSRLVPTYSTLQPNYGIFGNPQIYFSGIPGYLDSLGSQGPPSVSQNNPAAPVPSDPTQNPPKSQNFYAYFSTNVGTGYDPNDVNFNEADAHSTFPLMLQFFTLQPVFSAGASSGNTVSSPSPNPYTSGATMGGTSISYINPQSFQIMSPGADGIYGVGGTYTPSTTAFPLPAQNAFSNSTDSGLRKLEDDNLTNFHNGKLN